MTVLKTEQFNKMALKAAGSEQARLVLIRDQESAILRSASYACKHYVTKNDDEWSIALCAFSKAIDAYRPERGDFLPLANTIIKRDLIDYYRSKRNTSMEVLVTPNVLEGNCEPEEDTEGVYLAVARAGKEAADKSLCEEIEAANEALLSYGFRFYDLTECSPQQDKTRYECSNAIRCILKYPELIAELKIKKKLPIGLLARQSRVKRKTLDRYRKYIIMAVVILDGDYPKISEYLKYINEEVPK